MAPPATMAKLQDSTRERAKKENVLMKATVDHLLRLTNTIKHIRQNRKDAYITFLDVTKAYDKAWLDAILYVMHKEGTYLPTWKLVKKKLNSNLKATLKTKHGNT